MSDHGTHAGFYAHRRAGETACEPCYRAYRRWNKAWRHEREYREPNRETYVRPRFRAFDNGAITRG